MNVIFFCRYFYPHIGGVERHVYEVSKRLQKRGWTVTVIAEKHDPKLKEREIYEGITIFRIPITQDEKRKKYQIWDWLFKNRKILIDADLVHCHDVFYWYLPFRFMFPLKKVYTTFHGYEGDSIPANRAIFMHKLAELLSYGNICIGEYLKKWYKTKTKIVSYGAVVLPKFKDQVIRKKIREIVFVGRLDPETGILHYLESLNILKLQGFLPHMSVLGDGVLAEQAKTFVRKHRLNVTFFGFVANTNEFLDRADCVFTSRFLGILESFSHKKNVFALYNNKIHRDYLQLSPFSKWVGIFGNETEMSDALKVLIEHPHMNDEKIEHAYSWVKDQSWDKIAKTYLSLWKL
ncbi:MAG: glycosyltransferase family 4 protein [bacterium]|nr:glycosyltransferase family 4 protein [bacterium]